jgi:hypothetical protein
MDSTSKLVGGTPAGYAESARRAELLNSLEILIASYSRPTDQHRKKLLEEAIQELRASYSAIDALDLMVQQLEKEVGYEDM